MNFNLRRHFRSALETVALLNIELERYDPHLVRKPTVLAINKTDLPNGENVRFLFEILASDVFLSVIYIFQLSRSVSHKRYRIFMEVVDNHIRQRYHFFSLSIVFCHRIIYSWEQRPQEYFRGWMSVQLSPEFFLINSLTDLSFRDIYIIWRRQKCIALRALVRNTQSIAKRIGRGTYQFLLICIPMKKWT